MGNFYPSKLQVKENPNYSLLEDIYKPYSWQRTYSEYIIALQLSNKIAERGPAQNIYKYNKGTKIFFVIGETHTHTRRCYT